MEKRWCSACGRPFDPNPRAPRQAYCSDVACQKARKLLWQRAKRRTDPDYHQEQLEAQSAWREKNRAYWRNYRGEHPEYVALNREQQRERNRRRTDSSLIAKVDASSTWPPPLGLYCLLRLWDGETTAAQSWLVQIIPIAAFADDCKEKT